MTPLDAFVQNVIVPALVERLLKSQQTPTLRKKEVACSSVAS